MKTRMMTWWMSMMLATPIWADPIGGLTFQGRLDTAQGPAQGAHDFEFTLWDKDSAGNLLGTVLIENYPVSNGLFTVDLDFGPNVFAEGRARWIETAVLEHASTNLDMTVLAPRTRVAPAPFAVTALGVVDGSITASKMTANAVGAATIVDGAVGSTKIAPNAVGTSHIVDGSVTAPKLAFAAVTAPAIAAGAVNSQHITNNAVGSLQLAPNSVSSAKIADGSILGVDLAAGTITVTNLAAGSVGAAQLQNGAVNSAHIASGAVNSDQIAAGAVDTDQLAKPYRSGFINLASTPGGFSPLDVVHTFSAPFASTPIVTAVAETRVGDAGGAYNVKVTTRSASAFTLRIDPVPRIERVLHQPHHKAINRISLTSVQAGGIVTAPAFTDCRFSMSLNSYYDYGVDFWHAADPSGVSWSVSKVTTNGSFAVALAGVNGRPGVFFVRPEGDTPHGMPMFVRANNAAGSSWGAASAVAPGVTTANGLQSLMVHGAPATFFVVPGDTPSVRYCRALDANGTSWGAPVNPAPTLTNLWIDVVAAFMANNRPAFVLQDAFLGKVLFVRASDTNGATWGASTQITTNFPIVIHGTIVNGRPACVFLPSSGSGIQYLRADNADGTAWGASISIGPHTEGAYDVTSLQLTVANGRPVVFFKRGGIYAVEAHDANGDTWGAPRLIQLENSTEVVGALPMGGGVAALWVATGQEDTVPTVDYIWSGPGPAGALWTAVQP